jgi:hypothetical protein
MASGQLEDVAPTPERSSAEARLEVDERKTGALSELSQRVGLVFLGVIEEDVNWFGSETSDARRAKRNRDPAQSVHPPRREQAQASSRSARLSDHHRRAV